MRGTRQQKINTIKKKNFDLFEICAKLLYKLTKILNDRIMSSNVPQTRYLYKYILWQLEQYSFSMYIT